MTAPGRSHPMTHARRPRRPAEGASRRGQAARPEAPTGPDPRGSPERRETDRLRSPGRRPERLPKHPPILTGSPTHRLTHQTARHLEDVTPNRRTGYPGRVVIAITGRK